MAQQETSNSFALLVDEDVDDVSTFLDRVAEKVKTSRAAEENKQNQNQQQKHHQQQPSRHRQSSSAVKGGRWRGRGYQGHGSGRFGHGRNEGEHFGNGHQHNYTEGNGHGGSDRYQHNYGGVNGSQRNYRGYSKYGGDSARYAGNHNGNGRGRGSGSEENNASGYEDEAIDSQQKPIQDAANGSGREQLNEFQGMAHGSESFKDDVRLSRNGNHKSGSDRRGYDGGNSNFRGQEGHYSYGGGSERNTRVELSNNSETKEGLDGEKEDATSNDNSGNAKRNPPMSTAVEKDATPKQGKHETETSSDKAREEEEKKMTLKEYQKQLVEKRKALEAMKNSVERKVMADKDFESMQLVEKRKEDSLFIKLNSEKELKKKDVIDKEEKVRKLMSINEFLKSANGGMPMRRGGRGRSHGDRGGFKGSFPRQQGRRDAATPSLEDPRQFPILGSAVKA